MTTSGLRHGRSTWRREHVEELRGRRQVADLDVVLGGELQEALDARARVLGPLALEAVRQEQHEAREARATCPRPTTMNWSMMTCAPFAKSPNCASQIDEPVGAVEAVAVLEAEHARLARAGCRRSRSAPCARATEVRERRVAARRSRCRRATAWRWRERAAPRVLPAEAHAACPRARSDANARCSAVPQSSGLPLRARARGAARGRLSDLRVRVEARRAASSASSSELERASPRDAVVSTSGDARVGAAVVRASRRRPSRSGGWR